MNHYLLVMTTGTFCSFFKTEYFSLFYSLCIHNCITIKSRKWPGMKAKKILLSFTSFLSFLVYEYYGLSVISHTWKSFPLRNCMSPCLSLCFNWVSDLVKFFSFSVAKMFLNSIGENGTQIVIHCAGNW